MIRVPGYDSRPRLRFASQATIRVPGYIYLLSDGPYLKAAPRSGSFESSIESYWQDQQSYQDNGIAQETCQDFVHTGYGLSSIPHVLETLRIRVMIYMAQTLALGYVTGWDATLNIDWESSSQIGYTPGKNLQLGLGPSE